MNADELLPIVQKYAKLRGLDPDLVMKVILAESSGDPTAVSTVDGAPGARGLMQLMPETATELGVTDPHDPEQSINGGTQYLATLIKKYGGDTRKALAAYNFGQGNVDKGLPYPKETVDYQNKILGPEVEQQGLPPVAVAKPAPTYEQVTADPDFQKFSGEAQVRLVGKLLGEQAAAHHQLAVGGPTIGPGKGTGTPVSTMPEAFDRIMDATGITGVINKLVGKGPDPGVFGAKLPVTPTLEEVPFNETDVAGGLRGLAETAMAGALPFAVGAAAGLPAAAETMPEALAAAGQAPILPAWKTVLAALGVGGAVAPVGEMAGRTIGEAVGVPETGAVVGENLGAIAGAEAGGKLVPAPQGVPPIKKFLDLLEASVSTQRQAVINRGPVRGRVPLPGEAAGGAPAAATEVPAVPTRGRVPLTPAVEDVPPSAERLVKTPQEVAAERVAPAVNLAPPATPEVVPGPPVTGERPVPSRIAPDNVTGEPTLPADEAAAKSVIEQIRQSILAKKNAQPVEAAPQAASAQPAVAAAVEAPTPAAAEVPAASAEPAATPEVKTGRVNGKDYRVGEQIQEGKRKGQWLVKVEDGVQSYSLTDPKISVDSGAVSADNKVEAPAPAVVETTNEHRLPQQTLSEPHPGEAREEGPHRKKVEEMTPEEMKAALLTDRLTGLGSRIAYEDQPRRPVQIKTDAEGLKFANDNMGSKAGDQILREIGSAINEAGGKGYRVGGDEIMLEADTPEEAEALVGKIKERLSQVTVRATLPDGTVKEYTGIGLHHGIGENYEAADAALNAAKEAAVAAGTRVARGEAPRNLRTSKPGGVSEKPPEGVVDRGAATGKEEAPAAAVAPRGGAAPSPKGEGTEEPLATDEYYHGGSYKEGPVNGVVFLSKDPEFAKSYVSMADDRGLEGAGLNRVKMDLRSAAPGEVVKQAAQDAGIETEHITPASYFDKEIHGDEPVAKLIASLREKGYDHADLMDIPYGTGKGAQEVTVAFPEAPEKKYSIEPNKLGFYSQVERVVSDPKAQGTQKGGDWLRYITDPKRGVKSAEMRWTGLREFLEAKGGEKVSREEVLDYLRGHEVEVKESRHGFDTTHKKRLDELEAKQKQYFATITENTPHGDTSLRLSDSEVKEYNNLVNHESLPRRGGTETKYGQYTLPGGDNYREVVLTLPSQPVEFPSYKEWLSREITPEASTPQQEATNRRIYEADRQRAQEKNDSAIRFTGGHTDEPNALGWFRLKDRTDADGKKVLFVEEIQSDWAQKARRGGIQKPLDTTFLKEQLEFQKVRLKDLLEAQAAKEREYGISDKDSQQFDQLTTKQQDDLVSLDNSVEDSKRAIAGYEDQIAHPRMGPGVPDAPFIGKTEDWTALMVKRVVRMAAEEGYDRVAWTTGEQQSARYDLSQHVDRINWVYDSNSKEFGITGVKGSNPLIDKWLPENKLPDLVGKDLAEKIVAARDANPGVGQGSFSGLDLRVGGEGMKGFYDKIIPSTMEKVGKKWNVKVGETNIGGEQQSIHDWLADKVQLAATDNNISSFQAEVYNRLADKKWSSPHPKAIEIQKNLKEILDEHARESSSDRYDAVTQAREQADILEIKKDIGEFNRERVGPPEVPELKEFNHTTRQAFLGAERFSDGHEAFHVETKVQRKAPDGGWREPERANVIVDADGVSIILTDDSAYNYSKPLRDANHATTFFDRSWKTPEFWESLKNINGPQEEIRAAELPKSLMVHSVDISPEMRASVMREGFPQFKAGQSSGEPVTLENVRRNLPEGLAVKELNGRFHVTTPGGQNITISPEGDITFGVEELARGHGAEAAEAAKAGARRVLGATSTVDGEAIVQVVEAGVIPHEMGHVFLDHFATAKEKAAIAKALERFAKEEGVSLDEKFADGFSDWFKHDRDVRENESGLAKLYRRVYEFFSGIYNSFRPSLEGTYRDVARGKAFDRPPQPGPGGFEAAVGPKETILGPERIENFKKWFGDSKIVDEKGEPRVMYHGTSSTKDFNTFNTEGLGQHFGTVDQAQSFTNQHGSEIGKGRIYPAYLRIKKTIRLSDPEDWNPVDVADQLKRRYPGEFSEEELDDALDVEGGMKTFDEFISRDKPDQAEIEQMHSLKELMESKGYDGIVYKNDLEGVKEDAAGNPISEDSYIVFRPEQVKSATGNSGTFSDKTGDIRYGASPKETVMGPDRDANFKKWFGDSKVVDEKNEALPVYTGTSKDVNFNKFKASKNGIWFTKDPEMASAYAFDNDSQGYKYVGAHKFEKTNTASRVFKTYLKLENPKVYQKLPEDLQFSDNYRRAQATHFDKLKQEGYDGVIIGDDIFVAFEPQQVKSATGNSGTFSEKTGDIRYAVEKPKVKPPVDILKALRVKVRGKAAEPPPRP